MAISVLRTTKGTYDNIHTLIAAAIATVVPAANTVPTFSVVKLSGDTCFAVIVVTT